MSNDLLSILEQIKREIKVNPDTGIGYASTRATARLAGVNIKAVQRILDALNTQTKSGEESKHRLAETLANQGILVADKMENGIPDIIVSEIVEYYAFDAGKHCTTQAMQVFRAIAKIGFRVLFQKMTGYAERKQQQDIQNFLKNQIPELPSDWRCRFKPEFWASLNKVYGLQQGQLACAGFINHWVYGYFPLEVRERLNEVNPLVGLNRKHKIHQHFDNELLMILEAHISLVTCNLIKARNKYHFKKLMSQVKRYRLPEFRTSLEQSQEQNLLP